MQKLKKLIIISMVFLVGGAGIAGAEELVIPSNVRAQIINVFKTLDQNFKDFPWVIQMVATKTEEFRKARVDFARVYNDKSDPKLGETDNIIIWAGKYRYNVNLYFVPDKIRRTKASETVRLNLYATVLRDLYDAVYRPELDKEKNNNSAAAPAATESGS